ncbi:hypothetical protein V5G93_09150 [Escherichia albertii]|uniref:hypothetical protein n=1 Tax=Escherichia albertii TaxID=208962 RepID=UPI002362F5C7|nr:hypothetical protein [Escherichia albertii]WDC20391.1 hypothetical protein PS041_23655 [Escherichia albertii]
MAHFCAQYGFCWQGGVGIGGGAMIKSDKSLAKPPTQNIHHALCALAVPDDGKPGLATRSAPSWRAAATYFIVLAKT